jgi:hypothetical protein
LLPANTDTAGRCTNPAAQAVPSLRHSPARRSFPTAKCSPAKLPTRSPRSESRNAAQTYLRRHAARQSPSRAHEKKSPSNPLSALLARVRPESTLDTPASTVPPLPAMSTSHEKYAVVRLADRHSVAPGSSLFGPPPQRHKNPKSPPPAKRVAQLSPYSLVPLCDLRAPLLRALCAKKTRPLQRQRFPRNAPA